MQVYDCWKYPYDNGTEQSLLALIRQDKNLLYGMIKEIRGKRRDFCFVLFYSFLIISHTRVRLRPSCLCKCSVWVTPPKTWNRFKMVTTFYFFRVTTSTYVVVVKRTYENAGRIRVNVYTGPA